MCEKAIIEANEAYLEREELEIQKVWLENPLLSELLSNTEEVQFIRNTTFMKKSI